MCHYRGSWESEQKAKAEADRRKELQAKRTEVVDNLRRDAEQARPDDHPARVPESAAAK
jgi:hypothetical protein